MSRTVILRHDYATSAQEVWRVATDFACFAQAMKGVATFEGMPETGRLQKGQKLAVKVRLFGRLPPMDYHMEVVELDNEHHRFKSIEHGGNVRRWEHTLTVSETEDGACLTDHIVIDAGLATPMMTFWAKFVYKKRHAPRLRMLGLD